ncbi:MAG: hypothetical protein H0U46_03825 [Actinobacteria bacterium]|nr:hypothetical protein [Actinomycetota bacterium]
MNPNLFVWTSDWHLVSVIQLPADSTPPTLYTFDGETVLAGTGTLAGSRVTYAGTIEV